MTGIAYMDRQRLRNPAALAVIVGRHRRTEFVAAVHVHRTTTTRFAGVAAMIWPALNHAVDLGLAGKRVPSFRLQLPEFHLHVWLQEKSGDALHSDRRLRRPSPFFDGDGRLL